MSASSWPRDDLSLLSRLGRLDASTVSDAGKSLRVLPAAIRPVSAGIRLLGRAVTANARDDLLAVLGALQHGGPGDVLVVAAGGSQRAVVGELFASEAARLDRTLGGFLTDQHGATKVVAANAGAVESCAVSDDVFSIGVDEEQLVNVLNTIEAKGGSVFLADSSMEFGKQVSSFGGIVALLRYAVRAS